MPQVSPQPILPPVRVLIVAPLSLCVDALQHALAQADDLELAGTVPDWTSAVGFMEQRTVHVVLLDISPCCGAPCPVDINTSMPEDVRLVLLSRDDDEARVVEMFACGASGHVAKCTSVRGVLEALRDVAAGDVVVSPRLSRRLLHHVQTLTAAARQPSAAASLALHPREREVLALLATGATNRSIASRLGISESTVKNHLYKVYRKLDVSTRGQAVVEAARRREIDLY